MPTGFQYVYQERERTSYTRPVLNHSGPLDDRILNTAQMRNAIHLQSFRTPSETLDANTNIHASAARVVKASQPLPETKKTTLCNSNGPTSGPALTARGRPVALRLVVLQEAGEST